MDGTVPDRLFADSRKVVHCVAERLDQAAGMVPESMFKFALRSTNRMVRQVAKSGGRLPVNLVETPTTQVTARGAHRLKLVTLPRSRTGTIPVPFRVQKREAGLRTQTGWHRAGQVVVLDVKLHQGLPTHDVGHNVTRDTHRLHRRAQVEGVLTHLILADPHGQGA